MQCIVCKQSCLELKLFRAKAFCSKECLTKYYDDLEPNHYGDLMKGAAFLLGAAIVIFFPALPRARL